MKIKFAVSVFVLLCAAIVFSMPLLCRASQDDAGDKSNAGPAFGTGVKDFINDVIKDTAEEPYRGAGADGTGADARPPIDEKENVFKSEPGLDANKGIIGAGDENLKGPDVADDNIDVLGIDAPGAPEEISPVPDPAPLAVSVEDQPNSEGAANNAVVQEPSVPEGAELIERQKIIKAKINPNWANLFPEGVEPGSERVISDGGDTLAIIVSDKRAETHNTPDSLDGALLVFDKAGTQVLQVPSKEDLEKKEGVFAVHSIKKLSPNGKYLAIVGVREIIRFYNLTNLKFWDVPLSYTVHDITNDGVAEVSTKHFLNEREYIDLKNYIGD